MGEKQYQEQMVALNDILRQTHIPCFQYLYERFNITYLQYKVLFVLYTTTSTSMVELSQALQLSYDKTSVLCEQLEALHYIQKQQQIRQLTSTGNTCIEAFIHCLHVHYQKQYDQFTSQDKEAITQGLTIINSLYDTFFRKDTNK